MRLAVQKGGVYDATTTCLASQSWDCTAFSHCRALLCFRHLPCPGSSVLRQGDRVMVNMLAHGNYKRGQLIVFGTKEKHLGRIRALPGDTLTVAQKRFVIPMVCCEKCLCEHCYAYLVSTGSGQTLVPYHDIIGPASRLFYLPF